MTWKVAIGKGFKVDKNGNLKRSSSHKSVSARIAERKSKKIKPKQGPK